MTAGSWANVFSPVNERCYYALALYRAGWTLERIADQFGVTPPRARQLIERARRIEERTAEVAA